MAFGRNQKREEIQNTKDAKDTKPVKDEVKKGFPTLPLTIRTASARVVVHRDRFRFFNFAFLASFVVVHSLSRWKIFAGREDSDG